MKSEMMQIFQDLKTGSTDVLPVPIPRVNAGALKIRTNCSLISSGTEKMVVEFGRAGYLGKALKQREKVSQVYDKIITDGLSSTVAAVRSRLDELQPMGYSNVGVVVEIGTGVDGYNVGDRVVSNGRHSEYVVVPVNLCARIPDDVDNEMAAFTVVGSIALHGIRLLQPTLGEFIVVYGLGLVGLLAMQILAANGCRVLGLDLDPSRVELAKSMGLKAISLGDNQDIVSHVRSSSSNEEGADGVLITASAKDDEIIRESARLARQKGRVVLVGVVEPKFDRAAFYHKEISFQVSCSYGPGRYDPVYENGGMDYPLAYVRWTANRNFQAILELMAADKLDVKPLLAGILPFKNAKEAYEKILLQRAITVLLNYDGDENRQAANVEITSTPNALSLIAPSTALNQHPAERILDLNVAVIGAGGFSRARLLPHLKKSNVNLATVASFTGVSSAGVARNYGFKNNTNDVQDVFSDTSINAVFIATRHDSHYDLVIRALEARKHVFVEKPLCLSLEQLAHIQSVYSELQTQDSNAPNPVLMVGFNRRFSKCGAGLRKYLSNRVDSVSLVYTVNAGELPSDHWTRDPKKGGGRILGEACHFIDFSNFITGASPISVFSTTNSDQSDNVSVNIEYSDGSHAVIHYLTHGSRKFPKERVDVFSGGTVYQIDNFKSLKVFGRKKIGLSGLIGTQDKGHDAGFRHFLDAVRQGADSPTPFSEIQSSMLVTILAEQSSREGRKISVLQSGTE